MKNYFRRSFWAVPGLIAPVAALAQGIGSTIDPTTGTNAPLGLTGSVRVGNFLISVVFWISLVAFIAVTGWGILRALQSGGDEERTAAAKKTIMVGLIGVAATLVLYGVAFFVLA